MRPPRPAPTRAARALPGPHAARSASAAASPSNDAGWRTLRRCHTLPGRAAAAALWILVASGPLLGLAALGRHPAAASAPTTAAATADSATGPAGVAQLYLQAYLEAGSGTEDSVRAYLPGFPALSNAAGAHTAQSITALSCTAVSPGVYSVQLAAHVLLSRGSAWNDDGEHYFQIPIAASTEAAAGYLALALPAEIAAPRALQQPPASAYSDTDAPTSGTALSDTVAHVLLAYLTGTGELARYTPASSPLTAIAPAPYTQVTLTSLATDATAQADQQPAAPAPGTLRHVLATISAIDASGGTWPLDYALTLTVSGGQWQVTALEPAPVTRGAVPTALAPAATPGPAATATTPQPGSTGFPTASY